MKHIKSYEKRNFKDYKKYHDILYKHFKKLANIEKIVIYEEDNEITIEIKTWYSGVDKKFIDYINGIASDFEINPANGYQIIIILKNISRSFLDKITLELDAEKYNL
jgi:hypothetical protein